ncbi:MBL fold metallo-hydrolase [Nitratifractor sp.]
MRKLFIALVSFLAGMILWGKPLYDLKPLKVVEGITCSIGDLNPPTKANKGNVNNSCWIDIGDGLVIVDPGPTYAFAKEFAELATKQTGKPVKAVVVTNYHDDRLYGASYYAAKQIPVIAHKSIVRDIKKNPGKFQRIPHLLSKEEFAGTKLVTPDTLFDKKYVIKGSKRTVELLKLTPVSEERSDIVVWVPDVKFLFAGNIVFNDRALNYTKNSNMKGWIEALHKIVAMKPAIVLGGHGGTMGPDAYKTTLEYLQSLRKQVKAAYDNDVDMSELMKHVDLSKFKDLKHAEQLGRHNANDYYEQLDWE